LNQRNLARCQRFLHDQPDGAGASLGESISAPAHATRRTSSSLNRFQQQMIVASPWLGFAPHGRKG